MRLLTLAVLFSIALMGCRIDTFKDIVRGEQVREGVIDEVSALGESGVIDCGMDGRNPTASGTVTILSEPRYAYGEEGWIAVFIKHSRTLKIANASDRVFIDVSDNIELIEAIDSEFLPYVKENPEAAGFSPKFKQNYHVPLNENYYVRIRFRYLGTEANEIAQFRVKYMKRIPAYASGSLHSVLFVNHEVVADKQFKAVFPLDLHTYCHPTQWNTMPSTPSIYVYEHGGRFHDFPDSYAKHLGFESYEAYRAWLDSLD